MIEVWFVGIFGGGWVFVFEESGGEGSGPSRLKTLAINLYFLKTL